MKPKLLLGLALVLSGGLFCYFARFSIETLLWGIVPTFLAIVTMASTWLMAWKARTIAHYILSACVLIGETWALFVLYRIFFVGGWPTFLPHMVIGVAVIITIAQALLLRLQKQP